MVVMGMADGHKVHLRHPQLLQQVHHALRHGPGGAVNQHHLPAAPDHRAVHIQLLGKHNFQQLRLRRKGKRRLRMVDPVHQERRVLARGPHAQGQQHRQQQNQLLSHARPPLPKINIVKKLRETIDISLDR